MAAEYTHDEIARRIAIYFNDNISLRAAACRNPPKHYWLRGATLACHSRLHAIMISYIRRNYGAATYASVA